MQLFSIKIKKLQIFALVGCYAA